MCRLNRDNSALLDWTIPDPARLTISRIRLFDVHWSERRLAFRRTWYHCFLERLTTRSDIKLDIREWMLKYSAAICPADRRIQHSTLIDQPTPHTDTEYCRRFFLASLSRHSAKENRINNICSFSSFFFCPPPFPMADILL